MPPRDLTKPHLTSYGVDIYELHKWKNGAVTTRCQPLLSQLITNWNAIVERAKLIKKIP